MVNRVQIMLLALCLALIAASSVTVAQSGAQRVYIVAHGDNLSAIALRFHVSVRALAERNHLSPPYNIRPGQQLRLPSSATTSAAPTGRGTSAQSQAAPTHSSSNHAVATPARNAAHGTTQDNRWGRPRHPGQVVIERYSSGETMVLPLRNPSSHAQRRVSRLLRFTDGRQHPIDPRLIRQLATVSDHFGGRKIQVISGFRPFRRGQWTPHSNHNIGRAIDFRIVGVPNRVLRDYCRSIPRSGCGLYPRSIFVHMDVRNDSVTWVDWSRAGERPRYGREDHPPPDPPAAGTTATTTATTTPAPEGADESVDDVADDAHGVRSETSTDDNGTANTGSTDPPPAAVPATP